jgi:hypothetical protein
MDSGIRFLPKAKPETYRKPIRPFATSLSGSTWRRLRHQNLIGVGQVPGQPVGVVIRLARIEIDHCESAVLLLVVALGFGWRGKSKGATMIQFPQHLADFLNGDARRHLRWPHDDNYDGRFVTRISACSPAIAGEQADAGIMGHAPPGQAVYGTQASGR